MGSIRSFHQVVEEILLNNYMKTNFENSEIRDFVPIFVEFPKREVLLKKSPFSSFKCKYLGNCLC